MHANPVKQLIACFGSLDGFDEAMAPSRERGFGLRARHEGRGSLLRRPSTGLAQPSELVTGLVVATFSVAPDRICLRACH